MTEIVLHEYNIYKSARASSPAQHRRIVSLSGASSISRGFQ